MKLNTIILSALLGLTLLVSTRSTPLAATPPEPPPSVSAVQVDADVLHAIDHTTIGFRAMAAINRSQMELAKQQGFTIAAAYFKGRADVYDELGRLVGPAHEDNSDGVTRKVAVVE